MLFGLMQTGLMQTSLMQTSTFAGRILPIVLLAWSGPAFAQGWPLRPQPAFPPLTYQPNRWSRQPATIKPGWERVAQRHPLRWERVPSHELINTDTLAVTDGPPTLELVQEVSLPRRWELVQSPGQQPRANRADRFEFLRIQPIAKLPLALVAEQPLGQQAISAPCSTSFCNLRIMGRVWFRF